MTEQETEGDHERDHQIPAPGLEGEEARTRRVGAEAREVLPGDLGEERKVRDLATGYWLRVGSTIRPRKRMVPESRSRMANT